MEIDGQPDMRATEKRVVDEMNWYYAVIRRIRIVSACFSI